MENLNTPISKVASALRLRSEGLGLRATGRVLQANKRSITEWEDRFADKKKTLMLYAFCHNFISLTFEGDELFTTVGRRTDPGAKDGQQLSWNEPAASLSISAAERKTEICSDRL